MPSVAITRLERVGDDMIAVELTTPTDFEAYPGQFVLVRATIDGEEESGYYTISSPYVDETFETTVGVDPDGTVGPWFSERSLDENLSVEGPFGDIKYVGEKNPLVFARGPGIGPAVGIAERALESGRDATVVYAGTGPAHGNRLDRLEKRGATIVLSEGLEASVNTLDLSENTSYVFGFQEFVEEAQEALEGAGVSDDSIRVESFGPSN